MDGQQLKSMWRAGIPSFGAWITCTDPTVAAVICNVGYEWVLIDAEHHPYNPESLREVIAAVRSRGVVPIVRVTDNNTALIKQTLDLGAEGVVVPLLHNGDEARRAVSACRYPPRGVRGYNPRDATNFFHDNDHYLATIDDRVVVVLQVEHIDAVRNLDEILAVSGIGGILIGPTDLSFSMGLPLQHKHSAVQEAISVTIAKCKAAKVPVGIAIPGVAEDYAAWIKRGIHFTILGADYGWITEAAGVILRRTRDLTGGG